MVVCRFESRTASQDIVICIGDIFVETVFNIRSPRSEDETAIYREQGANNRGETSCSVGSPETQRGSP